MKSISIEIEGLKKKYGQIEVLRDVSIKIDNNSFISIYGKSGAGKSTFMNILGLLENYDSGEYLFNGEKIKNGKDYGLLRGEYIGYIFQSYHLVPGLTCLENIYLPFLYCKEKNDSYIQTIIDKLEISHLLNSSVEALSGGEKQRIAIARALVRNPGLIIADEPTGNLDEKNKWIVFDILKEENRKGRAIVLISHDKEIVSQMEESYILEEGKLYSAK